MASSTLADCACVQPPRRGRPVSPAPSVRGTAAPRRATDRPTHVRSRSVIALPPFCRKLNAVVTSSKLGDVRPAKIGSASTRPASVRSSPAHADLPPVERGAQRFHHRRGKPELAAQQGAADLGVGADAVRSPNARAAASRAVATRSQTAAVDSPSCCGERTGALRVHLDAQVHPIEQRTRQLAEVAPLDLPPDRCSRADRPARTDTGWRPAPVGTEPGSAPRRRGGRAESHRPPTEFAAPP